MSFCRGISEHKGEVSLDGFNKHFNSKCQLLCATRNATDLSKKNRNPFLSTGFYSFAFVREEVMHFSSEKGEQPADGSRKNLSSVSVLESFDWITLRE
jgi:hypothetical protein